MLIAGQDQDSHQPFSHGMFHLNLELLEDWLNLCPSDEEMSLKGHEETEQHGGPCGHRRPRPKLNAPDDCTENMAQVPKYRVKSL